MHIHIFFFIQSDLTDITIFIKNKRNYVTMQARVT
jgi:hypothetical protein